MTDDDIRRVLDRSLSAEPADEPDVTQDLRRGRRGLRRRRIAATAGAATCTILVAAGAAYALPVLTPDQGAPNDATFAPAAGSGGGVDGGAPDGDSGEVVQPVPPHVAPDEPASPDPPDAPTVESPVTSIVLDHLDGEHYEFRGVNRGGGPTMAGGHELTWGTWTEGDGQGTVAAGLFDGSDARPNWVPLFDSGPGEDRCAVRPVKWGPVDGQAWDSCETTELADGRTALVAEGSDGAGPKAGVLVELDNGAVVSLAVSVGYFERSPDEAPANEPVLDELPVTTDRLLEIASDPRFAELSF